MSIVFKKISDVFGKTLDFFRKTLDFFFSPLRRCFFTLPWQRNKWGKISVLFVSCNRALVALYPTKKEGARIKVKWVVQNHDKSTLLLCDISVLFGREIKKLYLCCMKKWGVLSSKTQEIALKNGPVNSCKQVYSVGNQMISTFLCTFQYSIALD